MTRLLIRSFLLSVLLLIGYTQAHAYLHADAISCASTSVAEDPEQVNSVSADAIGQLIMFAPPEKHVIKLHVREVRENEEDEHESKSFKKSVVSSKYFAAIFCGQIMARFYKQIFPFSYRRHLVVRVFRL